jgi:hypothetical protein
MRSTEILRRLNNAHENKTSAEGVLNVLTENVQYLVTYNFLKEYEDHIFTYEKRQCKVIDAGADLYTHKSKLFLDEIRLSVDWIRVDKLTAAQKKKQNRAVAHLKQSGHLPWASDRNTLWGTFSYDLDLKKSIEGSFNLDPISRHELA